MMNTNPEAKDSDSMPPDRTIGAQNPIARGLLSKVSAVEVAQIAATLLGPREKDEAKAMESAMRLLILAQAHLDDRQKRLGEHVDRYTLAEAVAWQNDRVKKDNELRDAKQWDGPKLVSWDAGSGRSEAEPKKKLERQMRPWVKRLYSRCRGTEWGPDDFGQCWKRLQSGEALLCRRDLGRIHKLRCEAEKEKQDKAKAARRAIPRGNRPQK